MSTLTLKNKPTEQAEQPQKLKGPAYYHPFLKADSCCIGMQSGVTWTGKLLAAHTYELLLDETNNGLMLLFKNGIEGVRLESGK